jgi:hypothetical protein
MACESYRGYVIGWTSLDDEGGTLAPKISPILPGSLKIWHASRPFYAHVIPNGTYHFDRPLAAVEERSQALA